MLFSTNGWGMCGAIGPGHATAIQVVDREVVWGGGCASVGLLHQGRSGQPASAMYGNFGIPAVQVLHLDVVNAHRGWLAVLY